MEVQFHRTGERRYAVRIYRKDQSSLEMNPAPGFDPMMPHDLLHLVVESELNLRNGIFGQIAAGGNAGTFHPIPSNDENHRQAARRRRQIAKRGDKLLRAGRRESAQSEHATYICLREWLARSTDPGRRKLAFQMASQAKQNKNLQPEAGSDALGKDILDRICAKLDDLSARWASLSIGGSISVEWPEQK